MHWTTEFKIFCQHFLCVERELWITWGLISDDFYLITWTISFVQEIVSHPGTHFSRAGWNRIFCGLKRWQSHPVQGTVPVGRSEPIYTGTSREERNTNLTFPYRKVLLMNWGVLDQVPWKKGIKDCKEKLTFSEKKGVSGLLSGVQHKGQVWFRVVVGSAITWKKEQKPRSMELLQTWEIFIGTAAVSEPRGLAPVYPLKNNLKPCSSAKSTILLQVILAF